MAENLRAKPIEFKIPKQIGISKDIRSTLYLGDSQETGEPGVLVFPGIFQDGRIPPHIAEMVSGGDVVNAFPYWKVSADRVSVEALSEAFPLAAIDAWREVYGTKVAPNVVAESLAGYGVGRAMVASSDHFNHIGWLRTAGVGPEHFKGRPMRELGARAISTLRHFDQDPFVDKWNAYSASRIAWHIGFKAIRQMAGGLDGGEEESIIPAFMEHLPLRHAEGKRNVFATGDQDALSTPEEHRELQEKIGACFMELIILENTSHRSMATIGGALDAQTMINELMDGKQPVAA